MPLAQTPRLRAISVASLAAACVHLPAHAVIGVYDKYFVTTEATSLAPGGYGGYHYYNHRGSGIDALPGAQTDGRGSFSAAGSSTDTTGRLTSAVSVADTWGAVYGPDGGVVADGSFSKARMAADLSTASLHLSVDNSVGSGGFVQGYGFAQWHDILNFSVAGATAATVTRVTVELSVDGTWADNGGRDIYGNLPQGSMGMSFYMNNPSSASGQYFAANGWNWSAGGVPVITGTNDGGGWGNWLQSTPERMRFIGTFEILGAAAVFSPTFAMDLNCALGSSCDYGHTATLRFVDLDPSVGFTSDSGVFMAGLAAPVPEPGTYALLALGLGGLAAVARRRRAATGGASLQCTHERCAEPHPRA